MTMFVDPKDKERLEREQAERELRERAREDEKRRKHEEAQRKRSELHGIERSLEEEMRAKDAAELGVRNLEGMIRRTESRDLAQAQTQLQQEESHTVNNKR